jgi:uncharacterized SAM-binding protein YcdF (DUF218 family)
MAPEGEPPPPRDHAPIIGLLVSRPFAPASSPLETLVPLYALPSLLALPPVNLLVAACAGALLRHRRAGRVLLAIGLAGLVVLALPVVSGSLMAVLEAGLTPASASGPPPPSGQVSSRGASSAAIAAAPQAIVILSGDQQRIWQNGHIAWVPGPLTLQREAAGAALARLTHLPVLVSGGVIQPGGPSLAGMMAGSLHQDFATDVRWQESSSTDTWQNAMLSAALLRRAGISRVYLVTHAWHMRRSLLAFRRAGLAATAAPVQIDAVPDWRPAAFLPSARAWQESYWAIHELIGWAWYAIKP